MVSARPLPAAAPRSAGVGELHMDRSAFVASPPNPNAGLDQFVQTDPQSGVPAFDAVSWFDAAHASVSWNSVSWNSVSWSDAAFSAVSWGDVSWSSVSWATVSWSSSSWNDVSWSDVSWSDTTFEDDAEADANSSQGYALTPAQLAVIMGEPDLAPDPTSIPDGL